MNILRIASGALLGIAAASTHGAFAGEFPDRPVKLVVPYQPGGGGDSAARIIADKLSTIWKQPVVVENRSGGGTTIGSAYVAAAAPDGYTLLMAGLTGYITSGILYKKLPYDYLKSLIPVAELSEAPFIIAVNPGLEAKTMQELIAMARRTKGGVSYASAGLGTGGHMAVEMMARAADVTFNHIPYRGGSPVLSAVMGGQVQMAVLDMTAAPHIKDGSLRALAVTTGKRSPLVPDVPTLAEVGVPGVDVPSGQGILAPAGTPRAIVEKINRSVNQALALEDVKEKFARAGFAPAPGTPEDLGASIRSQASHYAEVLARLNVQLE